jgi:hypothetical protein
VEWDETARRHRIGHALHPVIESLEHRLLFAFAVGERVQTIGETYCRSEPTVSASYHGPGPIPVGQFGTVKERGADSDGFEWYRVDWDNFSYPQADGWSAGGSPRFVSAASSVTALSNGVPVNNLSGAQGSQRMFSITVPSGASNLVIRLNGGSGDADLYVRRGQPPTTSTFDQRTMTQGNSDQISIASPVAGEYFIMVRGYTAFSNTSLTASYATAPAPVTPLSNGVPINNLSGAQGSQRMFSITVPTGASNLVIRLNGGSGDADLYVRRGQPPTTSTFDQRTMTQGNSDQISIASPVAGEYFIMVRGYLAYSGVTLTASFSTTPLNITARADTLLLNLIDQLAPSYYRSTWAITLEQFKAWITCIAHAEGGPGAYVAHSQGAPGWIDSNGNNRGDRFSHIGNASFRFSTGLGPFQLDNGGGGGGQNWTRMTTIDKLTPSVSVKSALEWHYNRFTAAGTRLIDFANSSVWFAVKTTAGSTKPANHWKAVTDTAWETHSVGAVPLNWAETRVKLAANATGPGFNYNNNVRDLGLRTWAINGSQNIRTKAGTLVQVTGQHQTWLITARNWSGTALFDYYYTRAGTIEVWVMANPSSSTHAYRYAFIREHARTQLPEHISADGGSAGVVLAAAALSPTTAG